MDFSAGTVQNIILAAIFLFFVAMAWLLAEFKGMKDEIQERLLVICAGRLSQYEKVCVVGVYEHRGATTARCTACVHLCRHGASFEPRAARPDLISRGVWRTARACNQQRQRGQQTCFRGESSLVV